MKRTIYRYQLFISNEIEISLPFGAIILTVQTQGDAVYMWALVDPSQPMNERRLSVFATGYPIDRRGALNYIGSLSIKRLCRPPIQAQNLSHFKPLLDMKKDFEPGPYKIKAPENFKLYLFYNPLDEDLIRNTSQ